MTTTTNFGFNIPDGTDNVNLLTQNYPNWSNLDAILKAIKDTGITAATATKSGANFAVVRSDTDCKFFGFVALSNYDAGDTFTVDGIPVTATTPAGTSLPQGAFVINQSVLACLNGAVLTVYVSAGATTIDAEDVNYDNSGSGLTATDVQAAIDELVTSINAIPVINDAGDVPYDNSGSGLAATNVQGAIDEIASAGVKPWTLIQSATGSATKSLDLSGKTEILIVLRTSDNQILDSNIPVSELSATLTNIDLGAYYLAAYNIGGTVAITNTTVSLAQLFLNNSNVTASSTIKVYAR